MQINIGKTDREMPVSIAKLFKVAMTANPDFEALIEMDPVASYVVKYGLTQCLNDSHSSITAKTDPDATARGDKAWNLAAKKLDALYAGELRAERVTKPKDTVSVIALEMALDTLAWLSAKEESDPIKRMAKGRAALKKLDVKKANAWAKDYLTRNPEVMEKAKAEAARRAELAAMADDDESVDLDALMADPVVDETPDAAQAA